MRPATTRLDREVISPDSALPRSFLACLPILWSAVLFPAKDPSPERCRLKSLLWLTILPGLLLYPCLSFLLFEPDEGRYAEIPREMLARGEWVVPYLQGEPYLDKPPLLYWLVMGSYRVFGAHDWSARLISALSVHACILLTYLLGRRCFGERTAFAGALLLSVAPGFVSIGRLLVLDGLLAVWVTVGLFSLWEAGRDEQLKTGWWITAAIACSLGLLTKGPVALVLVLGPWLLHRALSLQRCAIGWRAWSRFVVVLLALALPWYLSVCCKLPAFAAYFFWRHNVVRFLTPFDHQQPVWFYLPIVFLGLLPGSLLLVPWLRYMVSGSKTAVESRTRALGFVVLSGSWCVWFFSLSGSKLPTYVLPAFPLFALAVAQYAVGRGQRAWLGKPVLPVSAGLLVLAHYVAVPWYARFHSPMSDPGPVVRLCADRNMPVVCYPRNCDSVAFYLGRDDFRSYRSKETAELLEFLKGQPRTVLLFTHRHSPDFLRSVLPADLQLKDLIPVSRSYARTLHTEYCYMGVVENSRSLGRTR